MLKVTNIAKLFSFTVQAIYSWKKNNRPIINLLEKYFTDRDIEEFLQTGNIKRFDVLENDFIQNIVILEQVKEKFQNINTELGFYELFIQGRNREKIDTLEYLYFVLKNGVDTDNLTLSNAKQTLISLINKFQMNWLKKVKYVWPQKEHVLKFIEKLNDVECLTILSNGETISLELLKILDPAISKKLISEK